MLLKCLIVGQWFGLLQFSFTSAEDNDDILWDTSEPDGAMEVDEKKLKISKKVTPEEFLGPNAKLVDFDDLVSKPTTTSKLWIIL